MKHLATLVLLASLSLSNVFSQCNDYIVKGSRIFHANDIRTVINTGGDMFWDLNEARFQVPFENKNTPSAVFAAAVWIGGFDDVGNLKLAAQTYRGSLSQEYLPGPLTSVGVPFSTECSDWDTIWMISRNEVFRHISDYNDNGIIDQPQRTIFGWPGVGNPFFEQINGFELPPYSQGYAAFFDRDQDENYEPDDGDYPHLARMQGSIIPDLMTWHVFNDARMHGNSTGDPARVEVQQTTYAFFCENDETLNRSLFIDFKIVNRATSIIDSLFFGLWMDPDLGCHTDDMIGSTPEHNGFYVYNADASDGTNGFGCDFGIPSYGPIPPVLSGSFINQEMSSFMVQYRNGTGGLPGMGDPSSPLEFYRLLTGSWPDGVPLCEGGNGYNSGPGCNPVKFAFPGNPNVDSTWSMYHSNLPALDFTSVTSTNLPRMDPGDVHHVTMSFTLHLDPERDHLGNVELMYEQLPAVHEQFSSDFVDCLRPLPCLEDCVWPGDANNDGIANHYDILQLGLAHGKSGPPRVAPVSWAPHQGDPWDDTFQNGLNFKFADMNGDGVVGYGSDLDILEVHYGSTHGDYQEAFSCDDGDDLIVEGGFELYNPSSFRTITAININPEVVDSLYGLAFTILYDTSYFRFPIGSLTQSPFDMGSEFVNLLEEPGAIEYAATRSDGINQQDFDETLLFRSLFVYKNVDQKPNQHDTTEVCIANIVGTLADGTEIPMGSNKIQFIFLDDITDVSDVSRQEVSVYPNPSTGPIHFEVPSDLIGARYSVRQISGQLYSSKSIANEITQLDLPAGMYVLSIRSQDMQYVEKLVVLD